MTVAAPQAVTLDIPVSDPQLVYALQVDGIAATTWFRRRRVCDLPGYAELLALGREHAASQRVAQAARDFAEGVKRDSIKQFVVKYRDEEQWTADDPIIRFALSPEVLVNVAAALRCPVRLYSADIWCVLPSQGKPKEWSQSWHRDPEDNQLIKVMLYLDEVYEPQGPLQYIVGSHRDLYESCPPRQYPPDEARIPLERCRTCEGPQGTLVLVNTAGLHRGGYGTQPRLTAMWTFTTPANPRALFQVPNCPADATPLQRLALGYAV